MYSAKKVATTSPTLSLFRQGGIDFRWRLFLPAQGFIAMIMPGVDFRQRLLGRIIGRALAMIDDIDYYLRRFYATPRIYDAFLATMPCDTDEIDYDFQA